MAQQCLAVERASALLQDDHVLARATDTSNPYSSRAFQASMSTTGCRELPARVPHYLGGSIVQGSWSLCAALAS